jgi:protein AroM
MSLSKLTPREREILSLCADGLTASEQAERLGIALKTVEAHRTNLMRKLQTHKIINAVRLLLESRRGQIRNAA